MAGVELQGMAELIDKVNKLGAKGGDIKRNTLEKAGKLVKSSMEKKAPRSKLNKKHMGDNIKISDIEKKNGVDYIRIGPDKGDNTKLYYSKFTEWGTSKIPAQHWAGKSLLENQKEINKTIEEELKRGLEGFD